MSSKKPKKKKSAAPADGDTEVPAKGGGMLPKIGMLVALGIVSFGTVYLLPRPEAPAPTEMVTDHSGEHAPEAEFHVNEDTVYLELNPFTISLQGNNRLLKIGITLEVLSEEYDYIDPGDPKMRDAFTGYMRALRLEQIEDAAFMAQMRAQLLRRAQLVFGQEKVRGILITDFLVR